MLTALFGLDAVSGYAAVTTEKASSSNGVGEGSGTATTIQIQQLQAQTAVLQHELILVQQQLQSLQKNTSTSTSMSNGSAKTQSSAMSTVHQQKPKNTTNTTARTNSQKQGGQSASTVSKPKNSLKNAKKLPNLKPADVTTAYEQDVLARPPVSAGIPYGSNEVKELGGFAVITSPYLHPNVSYDGGDLIVNYSSINKDADMLQQRQEFVNALHQLGFIYPTSGTLLELSGEVEGQVFGQNGFGSSHSSNIDLTDAELDMQAIINRYVTAFANFSYDDSPTSSGNRTENSNIYLDNAFLSFGNLDSTPWRATIGQLDVPFGLYNSFLVSDPLNEILFKTKARPLLVGYGVPGNPGFAASAYVFNGATREGKIEADPSGVGTVASRAQSDEINRYGLDASYAFPLGQVQTVLGVSYINNVADSEGMQNTAGGTFEGFDANSGAQVLAHTVPGVDARAQLSYSQYTLIGEYTTAIQDFNAANLAFNYHGAKPSDYHLEGAYSFNLFNGKPTTFAVGYDHSYEALALNIPAQQIAAALNVSFIRNTLASLELRHQINYGSGDTASGNLGPVITPGGSVSNAITGQFAVYF